MATDVIIDPANGQIYWNDGTGSPQSISIGGNAQDVINVTGYSAAYSPGSTPAASVAGVLVKFTDAATGTLTPGTNAYELGSGSLRWKIFGTTTNISDNASALGTNTFSLTTGLVQVNGGIAISGNVGIGRTLFYYNPNDPRYFVGFRSSASLASTQDYILPLAYPATGSSVLQSDTAGTLTWVPMTTSGAASGVTAQNINIVSATTGTFFPLFTNASSTANGISGVAVSVDSNFSFDAASNVLVVDGATMGGLGLTTTLASFDIGNTSSIAQTLNFSNTTTGQVQYNFGTASASASTATFFGSVNSNRMILNVNSSGNLYIQTNQVNARVRLFQNNTTGNVSIFGTGGGTLYLGEDTITNNADIAIRGSVLSGGGGNVRAALFTLSTATSNGSGVGGTILFQTSTSGNATANLPNALRTRLRIEGAATGTSNLESIIILGDATSGTAWSSYLRGVDASGTDVEAGEIQIQAGRSTGTGAARGISFYVSPSGTTSSTINAASQIARFSSTGFTIYSTTNATSTTSGALIVAGGVGIGGSIFLGSQLTQTYSPVTGAGLDHSVFLQSNPFPTNVGAVIQVGFGTAWDGSTAGFFNGSPNGTWLGISAATANTADFLHFQENGVSRFKVGAGGTTTISASTSSVSTTSGALIVTGGVGIGGSLYTATGNASSVSGVVLSNGVITSGAWAATAITTRYGGIGAIPVVSKGDILVGAGNTWYNFPYSASNDQVLTVDTSLPFGLKWATPTAAAASVSVAASAGATTLFLTSTNNSSGSGLALSTVTTLSYNTTASALSATGITATNIRSLNYIVPTGGNNIAWYASDGTTQLMGINTSNGWLRSYQTTNATSTTSAALVSSGGLSVATNAMIGGTTTVFSTTSATGISSGAFNVVGGASINGNAFIGGTVTITNTSASGNTGSGALVVNGGAGFGGSVNIFGQLGVGGTLDYLAPNLIAWFSSSVNSYSQVVAHNHSNGNSASTDFIVSNDLSTDTSTYGDFGINSSGWAATTSPFNIANSTYLISAGGDLTVGTVTANAIKIAIGSTIFETVNINSSGTAVSITPGTASGTTSTGALTVFGGVGIGGSVNIGKTLNLWNPAYTFSTNLASGAVSATTTYILPTAYPSGTGTSYLSASTTGVMAWVAAPTSGGGTPGGSNKQIQYNSSNTFAGASGFEYTTGGIANTVSIFSNSGTGYTGGLWINTINGSTTRVGIGLSNPQFELEINGEISATNKSFVIDHPTKPDMKLRYGSLEGPENGVYVRGILIGNNIIETPDYWVGLVDPDTFTVNLTPIGKFAHLYIEKIEDYKVYVGNSSATNIHCFYTVWAERKDIPKLVTEY